MTEYSIVEYFAEHEGYKCGYCKSPNSNYSHGMWAHQLTVNDYQDLIDRGWRRSGKYCYKPTMEIMCCPMYTIKCSVKDFKLSKSQKKVIKRMNKFLIHGKNEEMKDTEANSEEIAPGDNGPSDFPDISVIQKASSKIERGDDVKYDSSTKKFLKNNSLKDDNSTMNVKCLDIKLPNETISEPIENKKDKSLKPSLGIDASKPLCRKAKDIRREKRLKKLSEKARGDEVMQVSKPSKREPKIKSLEDFLSEAEVPNAAHKLEVKLVHSEPVSVSLEKTFPQTLQIYQKYQNAIHNDPLEKCTKKQFTRFLVSSPLQEESCLKIPHGYGSFHQQYWLDGNLIAVGVIDILPKCVSSVYLFYDPDYSFLSLGTYAALREIAFTRELVKLSPDLKSYYMGFYIHTCPKMRYKGQYYPSSLLCPETFTWHPYEGSKLKLDTLKYSRLENDAERVDEDGEIVFEEILFLYRREVRTFAEYQALTSGEDLEEIKQYASLVGRKCYSRMLLYRS